MKKSFFIAAALVVASSALSLNPTTTSAAQKCEIIKTPKNVQEIVTNIKALGLENAQNEKERKEFEEIAEMLPMLFDEKFNEMSEAEIATEIYNGFIAVSTLNGDAPKNEEEDKALHAISEVIAKLFAPTVEEKCTEVQDNTCNHEVVIESEVDDAEFVNNCEEAPKTEDPKKDETENQNTPKEDIKEEPKKDMSKCDHQVVIEDNLGDTEFVNDCKESPITEEPQVEVPQQIDNQNTEETESPVEMEVKAPASTQISAPNTGFERKNLNLEIAGLFALLASATFVLVRKK